MMTTKMDSPTHTTQQHHATTTKPSTPTTPRATASTQTNSDVDEDVGNDDDRITTTKTAKHVRFQLPDEEPPARGRLEALATAFPTGQRNQEKARRAARKEAGEEHVVRKRPQEVEQHFDDCGEDMTQLAYLDDIEVDEGEEECRSPCAYFDEFKEQTAELIDGMMSYCFGLVGSDVAGLGDAAPLFVSKNKVRQYDDMSTFLARE